MTQQSLIRQVSPRVSTLCTHEQGRHPIRRVAPLPRAGPEAVRETHTMTKTMVKADAAGTWRLGETTVSRVGLGAMRLSQNGRAFDAASGPRDRRSAIRTLRTAVELASTTSTRRPSTSRRCARPATTVATCWWSARGPRSPSSRSSASPGRDAMGGPTVRSTQMCWPRHASTTRRPPARETLTTSRTTSQRLPCASPTTRSLVSTGSVDLPVASPAGG